jgi:hypothetical protein
MLSVASIIPSMFLYQFKPKHSHLLVSLAGRPPGMKLEEQRSGFHTDNEELLI